MKLKIPNWGSLCNPNLLTNSDFKNGIVNQKGQTGYTVLDQYSIDMWQIVDQGSLTVQEKTITTSANMNQYIDGRLENGSYCTTINVNGIVHSSVFNDFQGDYMDINVGPCRASLYYDSARNKTLFKFYPNSDKIIHFMKLEPGEHFTGMPAWDRPVEVMKCRRCFRNLNGSKDETIFIGVTDQNGVITFPISTYDMAKTPSVSLKNIWAVADDSIYQEVSVSSTSTRNTILLLTKIPNKTVRLYYSSNDNYFYIDAYNYG